MVFRNIFLRNKVIFSIIVITLIFFTKNVLIEMFFYEQMCVPDDKNSTPENPTLIKCFDAREWLKESEKYIRNPNDPFRSVIENKLDLSSLEKDIPESIKEQILYIFKRYNVIENGITLSEFSAYLNDYEIKYDSTYFDHDTLKPTMRYLRVYFRYNNIKYLGEVVWFEDNNKWSFFVNRISNLETKRSYSNY